MDKNKEKIKYIHLVFENCDCIKLTPNMFRPLIIGGIYKDYWINCFQYEKGEIDRFIKCNEFSITINNKGLRTPFAGGTIKDRILLDTDITHIYVYFKNGTYEGISVPWEGKYSNEYQKNIMRKDSIEIEISQRREN